RVVFLGRRFERNRLRWGDLAFAAAASRFAANVVCHAPEGDLHQPRAGVVRQALARPLDSRSKRRLPNGIFCRGEITKPSDRGPEQLRRQFPQQVLDGSVRRLSAHSNSFGGPLMICRTSIGWLGVPGGLGAAEARPAILIASSALSTSTIQNPAR